MSQHPRRRASAEKTRPSVFWPAAAIVVPLTGLIAKIEITGAENLPLEGPYVLAPNHYSEFDPVIIAVLGQRVALVLTERSECLRTPAKTARAVSSAAA